MRLISVYEILLWNYLSRTPSKDNFIISILICTKSRFNLKWYNETIAHQGIKFQALAK